MKILFAESERQAQLVITHPTDGGYRQYIGDGRVDVRIGELTLSIARLAYSIAP